MFSVVIPAYNCENTIEKCLQSVLDQSRLDLIEEIIIINDGSTDDTEGKVNSFGNRIKNIAGVQHIRFIYESQENKGVSATRNRGIRMASAEWIALLDSDDLWLPQKTERQAELIEKTPDMVFLGAAYPLRFLTGEKKGLYKLSPKELCIRSMPTTPTVVFKRDVGIQLGLFDESMQYVEDINFFQNFFLKDSYYVLAEELVKIGFQKDFDGQSGLSSHLYEMHLGRDKNTRKLYEMGLISYSYYLLMMIFNRFKYFRRSMMIRKERKHS